MSVHRKMRRVLPEEKLRFVCGLSEEEAQAVIEGYGAVDLEEISAYTRLYSEAVKSIFPDPQVTKVDLQALEDIRLNPNRITREQFERIPQLKPEWVETVLNGQPYYSMEELRAATALPQTILYDLFDIPPLLFRDKLANREVVLEPIFGRYVIPPRSEFDAEDHKKIAGYVEIFGATQGFNFRVVEPSDFEAGKHAPHNLKAAYGGNVHPVLRDSEGFERFLVPGSIDLWFKIETPESERLSIIKGLGLQLTYTIPQAGYYRVRLTGIPDDSDVTRATLSLIDKAQQLCEIAFGEPDQVGFEDFGPEFSVAAGDADFEAADRFWNHEAIDLAGAHVIERGSPDVTIFIIDSGCRMDHEELEPVFRPDWRHLDLNFDMGVPESVLSPHEESISHGTKVAGVARQMAPGCRVLPVKISGQPVTPAYGLRAAAIRQTLTYLDPGKRAVLNLSWHTNGEHIGIREALAEAQNKGIAIVASAGNYRPWERQEADQEHYPSGHIWLYPHLTTLCSVAALGVGDRKASYSYHGKNSITVAAPGGEPGGAGTAIYTTSTPDQDAYVAGTSFAAPHVAGLIALIFSLKPDLSAKEAIEVIKNTAYSVDGMNPSNPVTLGAGRINARRALESIKGPIITHTITATDSPHGTITPTSAVTVNHGADQTFAITPELGFHVAEVLVDGSLIGAVTMHTFTNVTALHTIHARFERTHIGRLNINLATVEDLTTLPLIGPWLAMRIVEYREEHGRFISIWGLALASVTPWIIGQLGQLITV